MTALRLSELRQDVQRLGRTRRTPIASLARVMTPRGRVIFEITTAGETMLNDWLRRHEPMPLELRDIGLVTPAAAGSF